MCRSPKSSHMSVNNRQRARAQIDKECVGGVDVETDQEDAVAEIEEAGGGIGETDRVAEELENGAKSRTRGRRLLRFVRM